MKESPQQIQYLSTFHELVSTNFDDGINACCWTRSLKGDFHEIVKHLENEENLRVIQQEDLTQLSLSDEGQIARDILLNDMQLLHAHGASPTLNLIRHYDRDHHVLFFPTDVYSFHVDRSPIPVDTFLCTYHGASSEIVPNSQAEQMIQILEVRQQLRCMYEGEEKNFESFLSEHFFDLHYKAKAQANILQLGLGHLWRLAVDHPESKVAPCIHRAPIEKEGESRLLLIC